MSDAPERIWAWALEVDRHRGQWREVQEIVGEGLEYIRADLHAAAIARAERAEAALARIKAEALYGLSWAKAALRDFGVDVPPIDRALATMMGNDK